LNSLFGNELLRFNVHDILIEQGQWDMDDQIAEFASPLMSDEPFMLFLTRKGKLVAVTYSNIDS